MTTNVVLLHYNNYFNRIVKKLDTVAAYKSADANYAECTNVNFDPNDGITTSVVLGFGTNPATMFASGANYDYALVVDTDNENNTIISRWFILESERIRADQYRFAFKRDVLADNYQKIMNAPCFVEKGWIKDKTNPLLFNPEGSSVNEIKQSETLLKDETKSAWLVGYIKKNASASKTSTPDQDIANYEQADSLDWKDCITYVDPLEGTTQAATKVAIRGSSNNVGNNSVNVINFNIYNSTGSTNSKKGIYSFIGSPETDYIGLWDVSYYGASNINYDNSGVVGCALTGSIGDSIAAAIKNTVTNNNAVHTLYTAWRSACINQIIQGNSLKVLPRNTDIANYHQTYVTKDNKLYQLTIQEVGQTSYRLVGTFGTGTLADQAASNFFTSLGNNTSGVYKNTDTPTDKYSTSWSGVTYSIVATRVATPGSLKAVIPTQGNRNTLSDELFDLFCIPYIPAGQPNVDFLYDENRYSIDSALSLFMATQLMTELGTDPTSGSAYDLQLLPYCPFTSLEITQQGYINLDSLDSKSYSVILQGEGTEDEKAVSFILFPTQSNFTKNIPVSRSTTTLNALELKLKGETDFTRLTSPNYNGMFEFKVSKLSEGLHYINVDCSYKPYTPYIKLNPDFSGLYGADFNDGVGLLCAGDFSLPVLNDAWINYQLSNKNYQNIFNRSIQNLDTNNKLVADQLDFQNSLGVLTGAIGGAASGAYAGFKMGGGYGAIAGGLIGGVSGSVLTAIGAEKDREFLNRAQSETKAYSIDMYNYQLGNIKALPQTISKSSPLSYNNKIWPILEEFSCTDTEKTVLQNKIIYNGMTIMAIGKLADFASSDLFDRVYVKGQLIRLDDINDDFHVADAIYAEVNKGFYVLQ